MKLKNGQPSGNVHAKCESVPVMDIEELKKLMSKA
jgi:hypothetical protein